MEDLSHTLGAPVKEPAVAPPAPATQTPAAEIDGAADDVQGAPQAPTEPAAPEMATPGVKESGDIVKVEEKAVAVPDTTAPTTGGPDAAPAQPSDPDTTPEVDTQTASEETDTTVKEGGVSEQAAQDDTAPRNGTPEQPEPVAHTQERPASLLIDEFQNNSEVQIRKVQRALVESMVENLDLSKLRIAVAWCPGNPKLHKAVIDGNCQLKAAKELTMTEVPVEWVNVANVLEARREAIRRNCSREAGVSWSLRKAYSIELHTSFPDMSQTAIAKCVNCCQKSVSNWIEAEKGNDEQTKTGKRKKSEGFPGSAPVVKGLQSALDQLKRFKVRSKTEKLTEVKKKLQDAIQKIDAAIQARNQIPDTMKEGRKQAAAPTTSSGGNDQTTQPTPQTAFSTPTKTISITKPKLGRPTKKTVSRPTAP